MEDLLHSKVYVVTGAKTISLKYIKRNNTGFFTHFKVKYEQIFLNNTIMSILIYTTQINISVSHKLNLSPCKIIALIWKHTYKGCRVVGFPPKLDGMLGSLMSCQSKNNTPWDPLWCVFATQVFWWEQSPMQTIVQGTNWSY